MRKRIAFQNTGILCSFEGYAFGLMFWVEGTSGFDLYKRIKRIEGNSSPKGRWENILGMEKLQEDKKPPLTNLLCLELNEFEGLSDQQISGLFVAWKEQIAAGHVPSFPFSKRTLGQSAQGASYISRPDDEDTLMKALQGGGIHLLVAPRRTGKTSLMKHLCKKMAEQGQKAVYLNLENEKHIPIASFFSRLHAEIDNSMRYENSLGDYAEKKEEFFADLLQEADKKGVRVLMLDEIVMFCDALSKEEEKHRGRPTLEEKSKAVFSWLSALFDACTQHNIGLLLSGSSPLDNYLRRNLPVEDLERLRWDGDERVKRHRLSPIQGEEKDWRLLLMSFGLVPEEVDLAWISEHLDLAMPYQAKQWLAALNDQFEEYKFLNGRELLQKSLDVFFQKEAFLDLKGQLENLYAQYIGSIKDIRAVISLVAEKERKKSDLVERLRATSLDKEREVIDAMLDILPFEQVPNGEVPTIRCVSKMFSQWWKKTEEGA
jgi:hypothetical protein